jgi:ankyrin repeat protein
MDVHMTLATVIVKAQIGPLRKCLEEFMVTAEGEIRELKAAKVIADGEIRELKAANIISEQQHNKLQRDMILSAATMGDVRLFTQLLDLTGVPVDSIPPDHGGETMLFVASKHGNLDVVSLLLGRDAGVDLCGADRMAPLYIASQMGHTKVVETLLERGANANLATLRKGATPLHVASVKGHFDIVEMLINKGAHVNQPKTTVQGETALIFASMGGHLKVVETLLAHGADPNISTLNFGLAPLHAASIRGHVDIVEMLISKGADMDKTLTAWPTSPQATTPAQLPPDYSDSPRRIARTSSGRITAAGHTTSLQYAAGKNPKP